MHGGRALAVLASLLVIVPPAASGAAPGEGLESASDRPVPSVCDGTIPHPPIRIADDSMFRLGPLVGVTNPAAAGTAEDPFVIEGWCITPLPGQPLASVPFTPTVSVGILIEDTDAHVVIRDTVIRGDLDPIPIDPLSGPDGPQETGIDLLGASNVTVADTRITEHAEEGLHARDASRITVQASTITENQMGIDVYETSDVTLRSNEVADNEEAGVYIDQTGSATVVGNDLRANGGEGLYADLSGAARIVDNDAIENGFEGLKIYDVSDATVSENRVRSNDEEGVFLAPDDNVIVASNEVQDNEEEGFHVVGASDTALRRNSVGSNGGHGIEVDASSQISVENNTVVENSAGVAVDETSGATVANNTVEANGHIGVTAWRSSDVEVNSNLIADNTAPGIAVHESVSTEVHRNNLEANDEGLEVGRGTVDARDNWWGASNGPSSPEPSEPEEDACTGETADGDGQEVDTRLEGEICFDPWLESPNPDAGVI